MTKHLIVYEIITNQCLLNNQTFNSRTHFQVANGTNFGYKEQSMGWKTEAIYEMSIK